MSYTENPFKLGQPALCINDVFPVVETTGDKSQIGKQAINHPRKGEVCHVDEILGEYIRFDKHDCNDENNPDYGWKWWKHTHFKPLTQQEYEAHCEADEIESKQYF